MKKNNSENDWNSLIPLFAPDNKSESNTEAIFALVTNGVSTEFDEWFFDFGKNTLIEKVSFLIDWFNNQIKKPQDLKSDIPVNKFAERKITLALKLEDALKKNSALKFSDRQIYVAQYRPFTNKFFYFDEILVENSSQNRQIFPDNNSDNEIIWINIDPGGAFTAGASKYILDNGSVPGIFNCLPRYNYKNREEKKDNITNWALDFFKTYYNQKDPSSPVCYARSTELREEFKIVVDHTGDITKETIFHYIYAILHNPAYRKKYEIQLKEESPRIPLYKNFWEWENWGKQLLNLHLNYETIKPYPLERTVVAAKENPKVKLQALKDEGVILLDENTELRGIPDQAWNYIIGNSSALELILDQYQEKKSKDDIVTEKFNTYRFSEKKEEVIDLLQKVCRVSVETMKLVEEMEE